MNLASHMSLALQEASSITVSPAGAERVPLQIGQMVDVRTKGGDLVAIGYIDQLFIETRVVEVIDQGSGTDVRLVVDLDLYDVWPSTPEEPEESGKGVPKRGRLSVHTKRPGPYVGGTLDY